jgi:hypothetical protein
MNRLPEKEVARFYKIHFALLSYINRRCKIVSGYTEPENYRNVSSEELQKKVVPIRDYLVAHPEEVREFIKDNPGKLSAEELELTRGWQFLLKDDFLIIKHLKDYSVFYQWGEQGKVFGVVGLYDPISRVIPDFTLPLRVQTVLLPFKDKIVYDGVISSYNIRFGPGIRGSLMGDYKQAEARYGIITSFDETGKPAGGVSAREADQRLIKFYLSTQANREMYWDEARELARKNEANRIVYEQGLGKVNARFIKKDLKANEIKGFHYAIYRNTVVAVGKTKKEVEEFCRKNLAGKINYLFYFKV